MKTLDHGVMGSGSTYIQGYIDAHYRPGMSKAEIVDFGKSCIQLAIYRDGSSGGCIRMVDITKDKITREFFNYGTFNFK